MEADGIISKRTEKVKKISILTPIIAMSSLAIITGWCYDTVIVASGILDMSRLSITASESLPPRGF